MKNKEVERKAEGEEGEKEENNGKMRRINKKKENE